MNDFDVGGMTEAEFMAGKRRPNGQDETPEPGVRRSGDQATPDGAKLLDDVSAYLCTFIAYPTPDAAIAHALWCGHTHAMEAWESTPRIAFLSPERGSGKTRALELTETLVPRPVQAVNTTPAYLFRKVADPAGLPCILFDEVDTVFGLSVKKDNEEIRAIINAGHRRGAVAGRCVVKGKVIETEELPAYCAVALAGLGALPDTILSRSVIIKMRRRAPNETVEPYRHRIHSPVGNALRDRLAAWSHGIKDRLRGSVPPMPDGIVDRDADVWEPLLALADAAGGAWPTAARVAAVALVALSRGEAHSLGVRLLSDLRTIFGGQDAMSTDAIVEGLKKIEEAPWNDMRGKPIDARHLARLLNPYGVKSKVVRIGASTPRGYAREDLHDPWARYLCPSPMESATSATTATHAGELAFDDSDYRRTGDGE
jgi:hypothetical protein